MSRHSERQLKSIQEFAFLVKGSFAPASLPLVANHYRFRKSWNVVMDDVLLQQKGDANILHRSHLMDCKHIIHYCKTASTFSFTQWLQHRTATPTFSIYIWVEKKQGGIRLFVNFCMRSPRCTNILPSRDLRAASIPASPLHL